MTTVVVIDDEALVRSGIRLVLQAHADMQVVAEAGDGPSGIEAVREHRPDVALIDLRMPGIGGVEVVAALHSDPATSGTALVVLTTFDDDEALVAAVAAGASGYLLKSMPPESIAEGVRTAAMGETPLAPRIARRLLDDLAHRSPRRPAVSPGLTPREIDVLLLMSQGLSNGEIATTLFLGEGTVKTHVAAIIRKLGVRDRVQAVVTAFETGLVTPR